MWAPFMFGHISQRVMQLRYKLCYVQIMSAPEMFSKHSHFTPPLWHTISDLEVGEGKAIQDIPPQESSQVPVEGDMTSASMTNGLQKFVPMRLVETFCSNQFMPTLFNLLWKWRLQWVSIITPIWSLKFHHVQMHEWLTFSIKWFSDNFQPSASAQMWVSCSACWGPSTATFTNSSCTKHTSWIIQSHATSIHLPHPPVNFKDTLKCSFTLIKMLKTPYTIYQMNKTHGLIVEK